MKFEVRNRFSGAVQFTADITCAADATPAVRLGAKVLHGVECALVAEKERDIRRQVLCSQAVDHHVAIHAPGKTLLHQHDR